MKVTTAFIGTALLCLSAAASADTTVTFGGLSGSNGAAFTGPYVEGGATVTATGGQVFEGHVFGNPQPSLVVGSVFGGGNSGTIDVTYPSLFQLVSFDQAANNGPAGYTVQGYNGSTLEYTLTGTVPSGSTFMTIPGSPMSVSELVFTLTSGGTSTNLDNIVLGAPAADVPEPATWAMMLLGFGAIGFAVRRKQTRNLVPAG